MCGIGGQPWVSSRYHHSTTLWQSSVLGLSEENEGVPEGIHATSVPFAKHLEQQLPGKCGCQGKHWKEMKQYWRAGSTAYLAYLCQSPTGFLSKSRIGIMERPLLCNLIIRGYSSWVFAGTLNLSDKHAESWWPVVSYNLSYPERSSL